MSNCGPNAAAAILEIDGSRPLAADPHPKAATMPITTPVHEDTPGPVQPAPGAARAAVVDDRRREREGEPNRTLRPLPDRPSPAMYLSIVVVWVTSLVWFGPRLASLFGAVDGPIAKGLIGYFVVFVGIAWLYGIYNLVVVAFALISRRSPHDWLVSDLATSPPVAVLYTTRNDFVEHSARSCVGLDYPDFRVYILDDSDDANVMRQIDAFAAAHADLVQVVRRDDRRGFKAGNLNHALHNVVTEPYFVIADSDEVLPSEFLTVLVPRMEGDSRLGFIQANHRCPEDGGNALQRDLRHGVDVHWRWYQPLRNRFGFVMFLGHGAILRRSCWTEVGGFPEIVSEDLAYAIEIRERGYRGAFAEDVVCVEEFPEDIRAFRVRHVKWTRGTCEFLRAYMWRLIRSRRVSATEKADILFPTLNLPLTVLFFGFVLVTSIALPLVAGVTKILTIELGVTSWQIPAVFLPAEFSAIYSLDFFVMTVVTICAPILCFLLAMWRTPGRLIRFLAHSTALYATLAPLTVVAVLGYAVTGKATFFVTGDRTRDAGGPRRTRRERLHTFAARTHPDSVAVRAIEMGTALLLLVAAAFTVNLALAGVAIGCGLIARGHNRVWGASRAGAIGAWVPATAVTLSVGLGTLSLLSVTPVLLGFMLHF